MQTFLPYANFKFSSEALDLTRLWKQCVEVKQLVNAMDELTEHRHHPACKMWIGYRTALIVYGQTCVDEWTKYGNHDGDIWIWLENRLDGTTLVNPPWFGSYKLHSSHRANLMRKDANFYKFTERPVKGYFWPAPEYDFRKQRDDLFDPQTRRLYAAIKLPIV